MAKESEVCPHCGALQSDGGSVCELCGSPMVDDMDTVVLDSGSREASNPPILSSDTELEEVPEAAAGPSTKPSAVGIPLTIAAGGFCTSCGKPYPKDARFCGSCGRKIAPVVVPDTVDEREEAPSDPVQQSTTGELGRQILIVVGAGVLLVVGLFFITLASKTNGAQTVPPSVVPIDIPAEPLPPEAARTEAVLLDAIAAAPGPEKRNKREELIDFYLSQTRMDLAGAVQDSIAQETQTEIDWVRAGNLYYDWMETVEDLARSASAKKAIAAYTRALEINPANHDVRTDMAIAYMYDPDNPMEAIAQTNQVLAQEADHVQANFNKGIMLIRIGRYGEAEAQFERVKSLIGDSTNQIYQRAETALQAVVQLQAG